MTIIDRTFVILSTAILLSLFLYQQADIRNLNRQMLPTAKAHDYEAELLGKLLGEVMLVKDRVDTLEQKNKELDDEVSETFMELRNDINSLRYKNEYRNSRP